MLTRAMLMLLLFQRPTFNVVLKVLTAARKGCKEPKTTREYGALASGSIDAADEDETLSDDEDLLQDGDDGNALYGTVEAADGGDGELYDIPVMPDLGVDAAAAVESAYAYLSPEAFENAEEAEEEEEEEEVVEEKKKKVCLLCFYVAAAFQFC